MNVVTTKMYFLCVMRMTMCTYQLVITVCMHACMYVCISVVLTIKPLLVGHFDLTKL